MVGIAGQIINRFAVVGDMEIMCAFREPFSKYFLKLKIYRVVAFPAGNYMLKVNIGNARTRCEICSKLTTKITERRQWRRSGVFIVNFEHILQIFLVFINNFEHVIPGWA